MPDKPRERASELPHPADDSAAKKSARSPDRKESATKDRRAKAGQSVSAKKHPGSERSAGDEIAAWEGLVAVHARLGSRLDVDLVAAHALPLVEFQVLAQLESAGGPIRMSDLAAATSMSRSGLTRVVDVLVGRQLVTKASDGNDGRVIRASISAAGRSRLAEAATTRTSTLAGFFAALSPKQTRALAKTWAALLDPAASSRG